MVMERLTWASSWKCSKETKEFQEFKRDIIHKALIQRSGIRQRFLKYDKDGNGVITRDEFRRVVEDKYQARLTPEQVDEMIIEADKDGNGDIDYDEFMRAFTYFPVTN